jgi:hypothetical protein
VSARGLCVFVYSVRALGFFVLVCCVTANILCVFVFVCVV